MQLGLGIDTGGTYTDAVLYDYDSAAVLFSAKSPTTHDNLEIGITNVLHQLPEEYLPKVTLAALSTTLATNACVEEKGARTRLLLMGVDRAGTARYGAESGLPSADKICFLDCRTTIRGEILQEPDWTILEQHATEWFEEADAICIVEQFAMRNSGVLERHACDIIRKYYPEKQIICGSDLFDDLFVFQRAASAILNGQLLPVIAAFLRAIDRVFSSLHLHVPRVTVRSDGTLMNEQMTMECPVNTLLSGPAASVSGGIALSHVDTAVIADMGGTTTDVAFAQNGAPLRASSGIRVGKWATFAKGLDIDTFALGGDTGVRVKNAQPYLLHRRLMSICVLCDKYPQIKDDLKRLERDVAVHTLPLHECFVLMHDIADNDARYDASEHKLIAALRKRPLIFSDAAAAAGVDRYMFRPERLENEGIIQRAGLTPTDIMHIKGDFVRFDADAPKPVLKFLARCCQTSPNKLANQIYDLVKARLHHNLARILLERYQPSLRGKPLPDAINTMIEQHWCSYCSGKKEVFLQPAFICNAPIIGLGAPIHLFLPDVAQSFGTTCILPKYGEVANAVGAVCSSVRVEITIEVRQTAQNVEEMGAFYLVDEPEEPFFESEEQAISAAKQLAQQRAEEEAIRRGAVGEISVSLENESKTTSAYGSKLHLSTYVRAVAVGAVKHG